MGARDERNRGRSTPQPPWRRTSPNPARVRRSEAAKRSKQPRRERAAGKARPGAVDSDAYAESGVTS